MNVRCPSCNTAYRIDPAKVPEAGVRARCTVCSKVIPVTRDEEAASPAPSTAPWVSTVAILGLHLREGRRRHDASMALAQGAVRA